MTDHASSPKSRQFKKLYFDWDAIYLMPGPALKIWLYHYRKEGRDRTSWPSRETLCENLGMNKETLTKYRQWLIDYGWLEKVGERSSGGEFSVPIFRTDQGCIPDKSHDGRQDNDPTKARTAAGNIRRGKSNHRVRNNQTRSGLEISDTVRSGNSRQELDCRGSKIEKAVRLENSPAFSNQNQHQNPSGKGTQQPTPKKIAAIEKVAQEVNPNAIVAEEHWRLLEEVFPAVSQLLTGITGPARDGIVRQAVRARVRIMDRSELPDAGKLIAKYLVSDLRQQLEVASAHD